VSVAVVHDLVRGETVVLDPFGGHRAQATGVNDRGIVVGNARGRAGIARGFAYEVQTGRLFDLGSLHGGAPSLFVTEDLLVTGSEIDFDTDPIGLCGVTTRLRTVPVAPAPPAVVSCTGTTSLTWDSPDFDGNEPISGYTVWRDGQLVAQLDDAERSWAEPTVTAATGYAVVAANRLGRSAATPGVQPAAC
jgi:probable HAF family extracellular repeat protein